MRSTEVDDEASGCKGRFGITYFPTLLSAGTPKSVFETVDTDGALPFPPRKPGDFLDLTIRAQDPAFRAEYV
jgi:hypothetical protein